VAYRVSAGDASLDAPGDLPLPGGVSPYVPLPATVHANASRLSGQDRESPLNPEPSAFRPQPSTLNPQPSTPRTAASVRRAQGQARR
jgi:hypothetical protein